MIKNNHKVTVKGRMYWAQNQSAVGYSTLQAAALEFWHAMPVFPRSAALN